MNPITRRNGQRYLTGTTARVEDVWARYLLLADSEPHPEYETAIHYGLTLEQTQFAIGYMRKRVARAARKRHDPKRPQRLAGKRNSAAGRRAEEWIVKELGPAWQRKAGAGRCDVEYTRADDTTVVRVIESKRRKGADKALRLALMQNGSDMLVRSYGQEPGVRQVEPLVIMRWTTAKALLKAAGQEVQS